MVQKHPDEQVQNVAVVGLGLSFVIMQWESEIVFWARWWRAKDINAAESVH